MKRKMIKIQFDTVSGVYLVRKFDPEVDDIVPQEWVFHYLDAAEDGILYGCVVDEETLAKIEEEYGVN